NSTQKERLKVLNEVSDANVKIVYICINKQEQNESYGTGNKLYRTALEEVLKSALEVSSSKNLDILVDGNSFIKNSELKEIAYELAKNLEKNIEKCSKASSNKCVRIADFIAGSIWTKHERGNGTFFEIIKDKIIHSP
ncbi:MAG: hypothetical protein LBR42_03610, partial [Candidatus Methanoplasma sp.]|nr:hypothetical protein [Candidatus Methanoplasma sp.]